MPPVVLKRWHSLKGKNLIPIVRKMKNGRERISQLARVKSNTLTEEMSKKELVAAFTEITGEDEVVMLQGGVWDESKEFIALHNCVCKWGRPASCADFAAFGEWL